MPPAAPGDLAVLRQLLTHVLPTSAQLGAFCARHFPMQVGSDWQALSWPALVDRLLARTTVAEVRYRLSLEQPAAVAHHSDYALQVAAAPSRTPPLRYLPQPRDPAFSGRAEHLGRLRGLLSRHREVVVTGPSGVGKTALASEFLHRAGDEYAVIYLLAAAPSEGLPTTLGAFAQRLHEHGFLALPTNATFKQQLAAVRDFLVRRADWLLAVDGVQSFVAVESLIGSGTPAGHLLYTMDAKVFSDRATLELGALSDAESLQLLARRSDRHRLLPGERLAVQRLAAALGYWPAALSSVADAVRQSGMTWIDALAQLTDAVRAQTGQGDGQRSS